MTAFLRFAVLLAMIGTNAATLFAGDAVLDQQVAAAIERGKNYLIGLHNGAGAFEGKFKDQIGSARWSSAPCAKPECRRNTRRFRRPSNGFTHTPIPDSIPT